MVQTTLSALFWSTITGVVVLGFRSSSVAVTHDGYLVESCRPLWNQDSLSYGADYTVSPFLEHNYWNCGITALHNSMFRVVM